MSFKERYLTEGNEEAISNVVPKHGGLSPVEIRALFANLKNKQEPMDDNLLHTNETIAPGLEPGTVKHLFDMLHQHS